MADSSNIGRGLIGTPQEFPGSQWVSTYRYVNAAGFKYILETEPTTERFTCRSFDLI